MSPAGICNCGSPRAEHTPAEQAGCDRAFAELRALREASDDAPPELVMTLGESGPPKVSWLKLLILDTALASEAALAPGGHRL